MLLDGTYPIKTYEKKKRTFFNTCDWATPEMSAFGRGLDIVLIGSKNHHKDTTLLIFKVIEGNCCSSGGNFGVCIHIFSSKIISK